MLFTVRQNERTIEGSDNLVKRTENGLYYVSNKDGEKLTKKCYRFISEYKNGYAVVALTKSSKVQRKYQEDRLVKEISIYPEGLIDEEGNEILPCIYDKVRIENDCIRLCIDEKWGYADFTGKVIVKPTYNFIERFTDETARVFDGEKWGTIKFDGQIVIPIKFDYLSELKDGVRIAKRYGRYYGVIDDNAHILEPYVYDIFSINNQNKRKTLKCSKNGETFVL